MANIDDKDLKEVQKLLNDSIRSLLYGGSGDPKWNECAGAAACYKVLQILNLKVNGEKDIRCDLETSNIHDENFLKTFKIK